MLEQQEAKAKRFQGPLKVLASSGVGLLLGLGLCKAGGSVMGPNPGMAVFALFLLLASSAALAVSIIWLFVAAISRRSEK